MFAHAIFLLDISQIDFAVLVPALTRLPSIQSCTSYSESFPKIGIHLCGGCPNAFASPQVILLPCPDGGGTYVRVRVTPTQEDSSHGLNSVGHHTPSPREI